MDSIHKQLDALLAAVVARELQDWPPERLQGALTLFSTASERAVAEAAWRLVARALKAAPVVDDAG
jgi:hypothetical protein